MHRRAIRQRVFVQCDFGSYAYSWFYRDRDGFRHSNTYEERHLFWEPGGVSRALRIAQMRRAVSHRQPNFLFIRLLARELQWAVEVESRRRLRSASSQRLVVRRTRLRTAGDRAFRVASPRLWNSLPDDDVASQSLATFKGRLKTFLFEQSFDHWCPRSLCYLSLKSPGLWRAKYFPF